MTDINHRRRNRKPVNQRHRPEVYHNGHAPRDGKRDPVGGLGRTDYLDKSMLAWVGIAPLSAKRFAAGTPNDFSEGHRGMARAVRGAKKFVRTRVRFHENAQTRRLARVGHDDGGDDTGNDGPAG